MSSFLSLPPQPVTRLIPAIDLARGSICPFATPKAPLIPTTVPSRSPNVGPGSTAKLSRLSATGLVAVAEMVAVTAGVRLATIATELVR